MKRFWGTLSIFIISLLILVACSSGGGGGTSGGGGGGGGGGLARATISGTVTSGGVGVAGASVSLTDMRGFVYWSATTDASGNFSGTSGPEQNVESIFKATKAGYLTYTQNITISPGGNYVINATI